MRLKIFEHILYSSLRPWKQDSLNERDFSLFIRTSGFTTQKNSINEFKTALNSIFPNEGFTKDDEFDLYELNNDADRINIASPLIHIELPKAQSTKCRFYFYLITNEVTRLTDLLYQLYSGPASQSDKTYVINNVLGQIKNLIKETSKEYQEGNHNEESIYILQILRLSLVRFLLEVENLFSDIVKSPPTTDEELHFDLLNDELPEESIFALSEALLKFQTQSELENNDLELDEQNDRRKSFKFKGDKGKLLNVIKQLTLKIDLLNTEKTTPEQFVEVLTAKDLNTDLPKVYFNCETKQVRYVFDKLKDSFNELYLKRVGDSKLFHSSDSRIITYSNLSSSTSKHLPAKNHQEIDEIFRSL